VLQEVDSAVEQVLKNITINDVVQRLRPCGTLNLEKSPKVAKSNGRVAKVLRTA
jgi:hypothetical protein